MNEWNGPAEGLQSRWYGGSGTLGLYFRGWVEELGHGKWKAELRVSFGGFVRIIRTEDKPTAAEAKREVDRLARYYIPGGMDAPGRVVLELGRGTPWGDGEYLVQSEDSPGEWWIAEYDTDGSWRTDDEVIRWMTFPPAEVKE